MKTLKIFTVLFIIFSILGINANCQEVLEESPHLKVTKKGGYLTLLSLDDQTIAVKKDSLLLYMHEGQEKQIDYDKSMFICLDKNGSIILNQSNLPVLVKAFEVYINPPYGSEMSWTHFDSYGRPESRGIYIYPCVDCEKLTGVENAIFVW